jgi:acetyltransferase-like isoleucine patch superfamily enzyme
MRIADIAYVFSHINLKTIRFNFRHFPFAIAKRLPVFISRSVVLKDISGSIGIEGQISTGMIKVGYGDVGIFDKKKSRTVWEVRGTVQFKGRAFIGHGSKISVGEKGYLTIGNNFSITAETAIVCFHRINIGDNCLFSWEILMMDTDFHKILDLNQRLINADTPITIGNNVWIGARSTILKGAQLPNDSIVAANSTVTRKVEQANCIYGGEPLRILKENISWVV